MRVAGAVRFGHSFVGVLLHPVAVALLVMIQWEALLRMLAGRPTGWKGRSYAPAVAD